jgi:two-component system phosphate regulon sensor histidine kinase PhoR
VTGRIFLKLILGVLGLLVLAVVTVDYFATEVAKNSYIKNLQRQLEGKGRMVALFLSRSGPPDAAQISAMAQAAGGRLTIVRSDGKVLADSEANPADMENHRTRPELVRAFQGGIGANIRHSATIGIDFLYVAVPGPKDTPDAAIRIAVPLSEIDRQTRYIRGRILISTGLAFIPAVLIAALLARWISRAFGSIAEHATQLAHGNFRARLPQTGKGEFGMLAHTLNETAEHLQRAVEQLQREHTELEKLERVRKDFVINVSHELRTPLASIQGYTETLLDGAIDDPDHNLRFLGIIRHNAERLARLTEDLLTLSRIEQKRQEFEFENHAVNGFLQDAIDLIRPMAGKKQIRLDLEPAPDDAEAWCDSEAVSQILANLLDNAIKYTPAGGRITVGARAADGFIEVYVHDTGLGIPAEDLPRLFERFYRVDKARSRELGGTGLGLSIVKHLVGAQGGSVWVESRAGEGSTFLFTLPAQHALNPEFT